MGNDLDLSNDEVRDDLSHWAEWVVNEVGLSGFRLDAVKHMSQAFLKDWIERLDMRFDNRLFFVGEYWRPDLHVLGPVIEKFNGRLHLFDVALAGNMSNISHKAPAVDLRTVFEGTLSKHYPQQAVVSTDSLHGTQHGCVLYAVRDMPH
jgi:alpha-amylase